MPEHTELLLPNTSAQETASQEVHTPSEKKNVAETRQPLVGVLLGYNNFELLVDVQGQKQIVFKHSVVSVEGVGR